MKAYGIYELEVPGGTEHNFEKILAAMNRKFAEVPDEYKKDAKIMLDTSIENGNIVVDVFYRKQEDLCLTVKRFSH